MKKALESKKGQKRAKVVAMIIYDESAPNWKERLKSLHVPAVAIYHDKDILPETGERKKPHWHVMIKFSSPQQMQRVEEIASEIGASNGQVKRVVTMQGYARYMCHLDEKEECKHKYSIDEVECFGGMNYKAIIGKSEPKEDEEINTIKEILKYCRDNCVNSYARLINYCIENNQLWLKQLIKNGTLVDRYIKSNYWTMHNIEQ